MPTTILSITRGMVSQVDKRPFKLGENVATVKGFGRLAHRNDGADPLRADHRRGLRDPAAHHPRRRINKMYINDLSPDKSVVKMAGRQRHPDLS